MMLGDSRRERSDLSFHMEFFFFLPKLFVQNESCSEDELKKLFLIENIVRS